MASVPIDKIAYEISDRGINERNTVSSGADNGGNNNIAARFWNCRRHGTTRVMADNLLVAVAMNDPAIAGGGGANIGGHGNEGLVETGMGQAGAFDTNKVIYNWNENNWGPQLDRLRATPITILSIWSCHTGAGESGADLLYAMAKRLGRAVRAGTGFLYSNSQKMWWENGTKWQVATPDFKPPPIPPPTPHLIREASVADFEVGGGTINAADVVSITFEPLSLGALKTPARTVTGPDAAEIANKLIISPAIEMQADIAGMKTCSVQIRFKSERVVQLDIINDRMGVDRDNRVAYYVAPSYRSLIETL